MSETKPNDLHYSKKSHWSIPMPSKEAEWHFEPKDVQDKDAKMGDPAIIAVPTKVSSVDKQGIRYQQVGPPIVPPQRRGVRYNVK